MNESKTKMLNVILLGVAFMLVFTAWQTMGNVQTTILNSAKKKGSPGYVEGKVQIMDYPAQLSNLL